jgi:hypothetical protein
VIDTASPSQPPLWPSVGALLLSGWLVGIAATILWAPLLRVTRFGTVFAPGAGGAAAAGRAAQADLVAGIRLLQGGLVDLAETAWGGDHRRELDRLRGLDEIHRALAQLDSVG